MKAMILAAGLGSRLRPYSYHRPKPLFPVLGRPLISRVIDGLRARGVDSILVNTHYLRDQVIALLKDEAGLRIQVEEQVLGTGGGLRLAHSFSAGDPVIVCNGDTYSTIDYQRLYQDHLASGARVSLAVHDRPPFNNLLVSPEGNCLAIRLSPREQESARTDECSGNIMAFTGVQVIDPDILLKIPADGFHDIIDLYCEMIAAGEKVRAVPVEGHFWMDMGTPEDYLELHRRLLLEGDGRIAACPGGRLIMPGALVGSGVSFPDWVCVGSGAVIGDGALISRSVIWDGARVPDGSLVEDEIIV